MLKWERGTVISRRSTAPPMREYDMAGGVTILVVDDDEIILRMLELILADAGYRVIKASNGEQALERVKLDCPDILLTDFMMPNMNGVTVCERLRMTEYASRLPVVIMSANWDVVAKAREAKASACLLKPFSTEDVLSCIGNLLDHRNYPNDGN